jgi:hypothetical protein
VKAGVGVKTDSVGDGGMVRPSSRIDECIEADRGGRECRRRLFASDDVLATGEVSRASTSVSEIWPLSSSWTYANSSASCSLSSCNKVSYRLSTKTVNSLSE